MTHTFFIGSAQGAALYQKRRHDEFVSLVTTSGDIEGIHPAPDTQIVTSWTMTTEQVELAKRLKARGFNVVER